MFLPSPQMRSEIADEYAAERRGAARRFARPQATRNQRRFRASVRSRLPWIRLESSPTR